MMTAPGLFKRRCEGDLSHQTCLLSYGVERDGCVKARVSREQKNDAT